MTKRLRTLETDVIILLPDEIWGVIGGFIRWEDDVSTLLNFIGVCRASIRHALQPIRDLCRLLTTPINIVPLSALLQNIYFYLSVARNHIYGTPILPEGPVFRHLRQCMFTFSVIEQKMLHWDEWRQCASSILSVIHLATLRGRYRSSVPGKPSLYTPSENDSLRNIMHWPMGSPHLAQEIHTFPNVCIVEGMGVDTSTLVRECKERAKTCSEGARQLCLAALDVHYSNTFLRAQCYYMMTPAMTTMRKASGDDKFRDIVLIRHECAEPLHIYSQECDVVDQFLVCCCGYNGTIENARLALHIEMHLARFVEEAYQRCKEMKSILSITEEDDDSTIESESESESEIESEYSYSYGDTLEDYYDDVL